MVNEYLSYWKHIDVLLMLHMVMSIYKSLFASVVWRVCLPCSTVNFSCMKVSYVEMYIISLSVTYKAEVALYNILILSFSSLRCWMIFWCWGRLYISQHIEMLWLTQNLLLKFFTVFMTLFCTLCLDTSLNASWLMQTGCTLRHNMQERSMTEKQAGRARQGVERCVGWVAQAVPCHSLSCSHGCCLKAFPKHLTVGE